MIINKTDAVKLNITELNELKSLKEKGVKILGNNTLFNSMINTVLLSDEDEFELSTFEINATLDIINMLNNNFSPEYIVFYLKSFCYEFESSDIIRCISQRASLLSRKADAFFDDYEFSTTIPEEFSCYIPVTIDCESVELKSKKGSKPPQMYEYYINISKNDSNSVDSNKF